MKRHSAIARRLPCRSVILSLVVWLDKTLIVKTLLLMGRSIGGLLLRVKGYFTSKAGAGDAVGRGRWSRSRPFEKSAHRLAESPVQKVIPAFAARHIQRSMPHQRLETFEPHAGI